MKAYILLILLLCGRNAGVQISTSSTPDAPYRAVKYSCLIDMSVSQELMPMLRMNNFMTYQYYIQYGKNVTIQILVPDHEKEYLPVTIETFDYRKGTLTKEYIFNHTRKYHLTTDSILYDREESVGDVRNLCNLRTKSSACDSVMVISTSSNKEYLVYFDERLDNISSRNLFYPNIKYLPSKIVRSDPQKTTMIREEMMYGQPSIDSLLQYYNHDGYERITNEEWMSAIHLLPEEVMETLDDYIKRYKERVKE